MFGFMAVVRENLDCLSPLFPLTFPCDGPSCKGFSPQTLFHRCFDCLNAWTMKNFVPHFRVELRIIGALVRGDSTRYVPMVGDAQWMRLRKNYIGHGCSCSAMITR